MAITQALCTSFKKELMEAKHNFLASDGSTFKIALYTSDATLTQATTAYSATNEVSGTGYTTGGATLTRVDPSSSGTVAFADFANVSWPSSSFTCRGALIYNDSVGNRAVMVLNFGVDKTVSSGTFTVTFPTADSTNAIIRID